eukprot:Tbor_TRINITY_DN4715_c0_g4::TRINITY_DN4715_c0_g4_i1::g.16971::m.16971
MSYDLAAKQVHRLVTLHNTKSILPGGRVVSVEEGRHLAKVTRESVGLPTNTNTADEECDIMDIEGDEYVGGKKLSSNHGGTITLESDMNRKIINLRQKQNKEVNIQRAIARVKEERIPHTAIIKEMAQVRKVADKVLHTSKDPAAVKAARKKRIGIVSKKKKSDK